MRCILFSLTSGSFNKLNCCRWCLDPASSARLPWLGRAPLAVALHEDGAGRRVDGNDETFEGVDSVALNAQTCALAEVLANEGARAQADRG